MQASKYAVVGSPIDCCNKPCCDERAEKGTSHQTEDPEIYSASAVMKEEPAPGLAWPSWSSTAIIIHVVHDTQANDLRSGVDEALQGSERSEACVTRG